MKNFKILKFVSIVFCGLYINSVSAIGSYPDVQKYINDLVDQGSAVLQDKTLSQDLKVQKSKILIANNLDLEWMARYTLGRHINKLSEAQIKDFIDTYSQYVMMTYSEMTRSYQGQKMTILQIKCIDANEFMVKSEIESAQGTPVKVEYMVFSKHNKATNSFKVADIVTEGISMINAQQEEFASVINSKGFDALSSSLKSKIVGK